MFVLLLLSVVAIHASPMGKVIPVFEDVTSIRQLADPWVVQHNLCHDDCHHHILHKPMFLVRSLPGAHTLHFSPGGLNGLGKSPLTMPLREAILAPESQVIAVFPFARFPWELFPGLLDSEVVIPEHVTKMSSFYREAPVVAIFPEEEFRKINEHRGLIQVADFTADSTGITVAKDLALLNRNAALGVSLTVTSTPAFAAAPAVQRDVTPVHLQQSFTPATKTVIYPIAGGIPQYSGNIGNGETLKYFHYIPIGSTYIPDGIARS